MKKQNEPKIEQSEILRSLGEGGQNQKSVKSVVSKFYKTNPKYCFLAQKQALTKKQSQIKANLGCLCSGSFLQNKPKIEHSEILHSFSEGGQTRFFFPKDRFSMILTFLVDTYTKSLHYIDKRNFFGIIRFNCF
jgi:hypothetical protein